MSQVTPGTSNRRDDRWHVGREIPLVLLFGLIVQTGGWIWWAATLSAKQDGIISMMADFKMAQYTQADARRDMEMNSARHLENRRRIEMLEARQIPPKTRYLKDYQ